jgi:hypothetical protein
MLSFENFGCSSVKVNKCGGLYAENRSLLYRDYPLAVCRGDLKQERMEHFAGDLCSVTFAVAGESSGVEGFPDPSQDSE